MRQLWSTSWGFSACAPDHESRCDDGMHWFQSPFYPLEQELGALRTGQVARLVDRSQRYPADRRGIDIVVPRYRQVFRDPDVLLFGGPEGSERGDIISCKD